MSEPARHREDAEILAEMNTDFERLHNEAHERARYDSELRDWDAVLLDGLEREPTQAP